MFMELVAVYSENNSESINTAWEFADKISPSSMLNFLIHKVATWLYTAEDAIPST